MTLVTTYHHLPPATLMSFPHNQPEYTVSEIAGHVKRMVEETFGYVRVRGEVSKASVNAASGHCYLSLKDERAVLDAVVWKGTMSKLAHKPQAGMEVIATGKLTTYPGSSKYQLIIESIEPAGIGALMAMLEKRKKELAAEGLFDSSRKKPLPFLPTTIGIITSPTGAVIRDILHRLADRFPRHVLLWPVPVQGEGAAEKIAAAIRGFNALPLKSDCVAGESGKPSPLAGEGLDEGGRSLADNCHAPSPLALLDPLPQGERDAPASPLQHISGAGAVCRPDILIVARGGGSIEDLWAFNEEVVVRAAAASTIPLISAVGHETDTTLIDFASDRRAPTPTAAAEMAVPVREELLGWIEQLGAQQTMAMRKQLSLYRERIDGLARGLPRPQQLVATMEQTLDGTSERLAVAISQRLEMLHHKLQHMAAQLPRPQQLVTLKSQQLEALGARLGMAVARNLEQRGERYTRIAAGLRAGLVTERIARAQQTLQHLAAMLESLNVLSVLKRGFVLVKEASGQVVTAAAAMPENAALTLQFHDGERVVTSGNAAPPPAAKRRPKLPNTQSSLFEA